MNYETDHKPMGAEFVLYLFPLYLDAIGGGLPQRAINLCRCINVTQHPITLIIPISAVCYLKLCDAITPYSIFTKESSRSWSFCTNESHWVHYRTYMTLLGKILYSH